MTTEGSQTPPISETSSTPGEWRDAVLCPENRVIAGYWNSPPFHDEPKLYHLNARLQPPANWKDDDLEVDGDSIATVGGASLSKERALFKVAGEAIERFALFVNQSSASKFCSFQSFRSGEALNPSQVAVGREASSRDRRSDAVNWVEGVHLTDARPVWIPSQLVFVPHLFSPDEVVWRAPISTGAAAFNNLSEALLRGLCEVVERDSFMVCWLLQITPDLIGNPVLRHLCERSDLLRSTIERSHRYLLKPRFYALPSNLPLHVIICVLQDETGQKPRFNLGAKASLSLGTAILGALEEAYQLRPWTRRLAGESVLCEIPNDELNPKSIRERARLWLTDMANSNMEAWLTDANEWNGQGKNIDFNVSLNDLIESVQRDGASVFSVETTSNLPNVITTTGVRTVKVVVPEYQPLYLTEELGDIALGRLATAQERLGRVGKRSVDNPFSFPHPFL
jgi:ribosomal protein S12 methylthiotransferase accessory factor